MGFPSTSKREGKVIFFRLNLAENTAEPIKPEIQLDFDHFESDDCLTVLMFNQK